MAHATTGINVRMVKMMAVIGTALELPLATRNTSTTMWMTKAIVTVVRPDDIATKPPNIGMPKKSSYKNAINVVVINMRILLSY